MNKEILKLAIPNVISNISVPLLSTVDTALMGRLSEFHLGAVGVGAMIFNFIYWNFGFLRMGTTGITAQAYGKEDKVEIMQTLSRACFVAVCIICLVLVFQKPLADISFHLMNISDEQCQLVKDYFYIRIWAAPATILLFAFLGWFFGMQNAIIPLCITIFINVVNIIFSYVLTYKMEMGIAGVAWGTVIAQYAGLALAIILFLLKYSNLLKAFSRKKTMEFVALKKYLSINRDIFIRTVCLTFAFGFFYAQSSKEGALILAVNVVLLQFVNWMSYGIDGFAYASESLVGKYHGAQNENALKRVIVLSFLWAIFLAVIYSLVYGFFGESLLYIFTDQKDIIEKGKTFLIWMLLFPIIATASYIWDGVYIGLTASRAMMQTMIVSLIIYVASYYLGFKQLGNHGLWAALLLFLAARGLFQYVYYLRYLKPQLLSHS